MQGIRCFRATGFGWSYWGLRSTWGTGNCEGCNTTGLLHGGVTKRACFEGRLGELKLCDV